MRKFVIKNRQKRKYIKKTEEFHSFSFSKTMYNLLPLLIMLIAFMATLVISAPLRDQLSHIRVSFTLPEFSLDNPLNANKALLTNTIQGSAALWTACVTLFVILGQSLGKISVTIIHLFALFDPRPLFLLIGTSVMTVGDIFVQMINLLMQSLIKISALLVHYIILISSLIVTGVTIVSSIIIQLVGTFVHFLLMIAQVIGAWLLSVIVAIGKAIDTIVLTIVHVIEIPFNVLGAFWEQIKPYITIFGKHVQMSGSDLSNGFASWGKVASLMSSPK